MLLVAESASEARGVTARRGGEIRLACVGVLEHALRYRNALCAEDQT
jgi:hypothetical protein